jgi:hypothetical protein
MGDVEREQAALDEAAKVYRRTVPEWRNRAQRRLAGRIAQPRDGATRPRLDEDGDE